MRYRETSRPRHVPFEGHRNPRVQPGVSSFIELSRLPGASHPGCCSHSQRQTLLAVTVELPDQIGASDVLGEYVGCVLRNADAQCSRPASHFLIHVLGRTRRDERPIALMRLSHTGSLAVRSSYAALDTPSLVMFS